VAAIGCCVKWAGLIMQISRVGGAPGCQSSGSVSLFYSYSRASLGRKLLLRIARRPGDGNPLSKGSWGRSTVGDGGKDPRS